MDKEQYENILNSYSDIEDTADEILGRLYPKKTFEITFIEGSIFAFEYVLDSNDHRIFTDMKVEIPAKEVYAVL